MIINHNMRPLLIFPHMLLKMFVKYVPRTPVQRSSGSPNVGEICSSSNRPISAACWMCIGISCFKLHRAGPGYAQHSRESKDS